METRPRVRTTIRKFSKELRGTMTDGERRLWNALRGRRLSGWKFKRQHPIGRFIVDFVCDEAKLVVEIDGGQHAVRVEQDARRSQYLAGLGYRVIRFSARDALSQTENVLTTIYRELTAHSSAQKS